MPQPASRFRRAERRAVNLRMAIDGPTGAGKTLTGLLIARGLVGPEGTIAVIDTEHGTAEKFYADRVEFDALELTEHQPARYIEAIGEAASAGYGCLMIDSLSHAWEGVLAMVDAKGGEFGAWRHVTPHHNALVQALLTFPGHLIVTMRSKMAYEVTRNGDGKTAVSKLGLQPVQRAGLEYEFDLVCDVDTAHQLGVSKSRVPALADRVVMMAGEEFGREIGEAISVGKPDVSARMARLLYVAGTSKRELVEALQADGVASSEALADPDLWAKAQRVAQALRVGPFTPPAPRAAAPPPPPADEGDDKGDGDPPADPPADGPRTPHDGPEGPSLGPRTPEGPEDDGEGEDEGQGEPYAEGGDDPAGGAGDDAAADAAWGVAAGTEQPQPSGFRPETSHPDDDAAAVAEPEREAPARKAPPTVTPAEPGTPRGRLATMRLRGLETMGASDDALVPILEAELGDPPNVYLLGDDDLYNRVRGLVAIAAQRSPART